MHDSFKFPLHLGSHISSSRIVLYFYFYVHKNANCYDCHCLGLSIKCNDACTGDDALAPSLGTVNTSQIMINASAVDS